MASFTKGRALIVGVGEYPGQDATWQAPTTVVEAQAVYDALCDVSVAGYPTDQVNCLLNEKATLAEVKDALKELAENAKRDETVVIYYCAHGGEDNADKYRLATYDTTFSDNNTLESGLLGGDLVEALTKIRARKLLVIINTCFSGKVFSVRALGPGEEAATPKTLGTPVKDNLRFAMLGTGEGRAVFVACRENQKSKYVEDDKPTYFGQALIEGLRGEGVYNREGFVDVYDLALHVGKKLKQVTTGQEPVLSLERTIGPFPVALYPTTLAARSLGGESLQETPPENTDVIELVDMALVERIKGILDEEFRKIKQQRSLLDFGNHNEFRGAVTIGDVINGDKITSVVQYHYASGNGAPSGQSLEAAIEPILRKVELLHDSGALTINEKEDLTTALTQAKTASTRGDRGRVRTRLESAQATLSEVASNAAEVAQLRNDMRLLIQQARDA